MVISESFFHLGTKKWFLVALDKWLSYTSTIVREPTWEESVLVVLDEWSSYRWSFDCIIKNLLISLTFPFMVVVLGLIYERSFSKFPCYFSNLRLFYKTVFFFHLFFILFSSYLYLRI